MSDIDRIPGAGTEEPRDPVADQKEYLRNQRDINKAKAAAEKKRRRAGRPMPVPEYWNSTMRPILFGKQSTYVVHAATLKKTVNQLLDDEVVTDEEQLKELIDVFAGKVRIGEIDVTGKSAWWVFVKSVPRLSAASITEIRGESELIDDDWLL